MKYKMEIVMSYWQTVVIEADSRADAENRALYEFDITKARIGEGEVYDTELIKNAKYVVRNHNGTLLGTFSHKDDAERDAKEYRYQTGNAAYVDEENDDES